MEDRLDHHGRVLGQILLAQADRNNRPVDADPDITSAAVTSIGTPPIQVALTRPSQRVPFALCKDCACQCHLTQRLGVTWWKSLAGALSISKTGSAFLGAACNLKDCPSPSTPTARASIFLPHWIASRAILLTLVAGSSPTLSLNLAKVMPADSEFFRYIQLGCCDKVQEFLEAGKSSPGDLVELSYGTLSALFFALNSGQAQVCKLLLSWGADPNYENETFLTSSATDMAWTLSQEYDAASTVDREDRLDSIFPFPRDLLERRQFPRLTKIILGLSGCNLDAALQVATAADFAETDRHGRTVLHWSGWKGNARELRRILLAGADPNVPDPAGRIPLHFSAMTSSAACTEVLTELGADVSRADCIGETPLHCACSTGKLANVTCLLSAGADADASTLKGTTPLMSAVSSGSLEVVRTILRHGVNVQAVDAAGESAVSLAVWMNRHDMVRILASEGQANMDVTTCSGRSILHTVAQYGDIQMVETFLDIHLGTPALSKSNYEGITALDQFQKRPDRTPALTKAFNELINKTNP